MAYRDSASGMLAAEENLAVIREINEETGGIIVPQEWIMRGGH